MDFNYEEYNANKERFGDHTFQVDWHKIPKQQAGSGEAPIPEKSSRYATTLINSGKRKLSLVSNVSRSDK